MIYNLNIYTANVFHAGTISKKDNISRQNLFIHHVYSLSHNLNKYLKIIYSVLLIYILSRFADIGKLKELY